MDQILGYWRDASTRIRESAKWMAAVTAAALAVLIGTSPLTKVAESDPARTGDGRCAVVDRHLDLDAQSPAATGNELCRCAVRPRDNGPSASAVMRRFGDAFLDRAAWMVSASSIAGVEGDGGIAAGPVSAGIKCLTSLRQAMIIEEVTLAALARAIYDLHRRRPLARHSCRLSGHAKFGFVNCAWQSAGGGHW